MIKLKAVTGWLNRYFDWLVLLVFIAFSAWLMFGTFGYADGKFLMDSKLRSDFASHIPLIRSFSVGQNFPPEYPFYAGVPIQYHYLFYLGVGGLEWLGVNLALGLNLLSTVGFTLLLLMIYKITLLFFKSRWLGLLAIILFLFNGSLSYVEFLDKQGWALETLLQIPRQIQFASFGPWSGKLVSAFWSLNIYTNQRHLAMSYGLVLALIYPLLLTLRNKKLKLQPILKIAIVLGFLIFPLLHQAGYMMLVIFSLVWISLYWKRCQGMVDAYGLGLVLSLLTFFFFTTGGSQSISVEVGYLSTNSDWLAMLNYWLYNIGLYLVFIPVLLWWSKRRGNYFLLIFYLFFVLANLFKLSTDMINNHKLLNFFMIGMVIVTAGFLGALWKKTKLGIPVVLLLLVALTLGGVTDFFPIINDYQGEVRDYAESEVGQYIAQQTNPRDQFLTASYLYNPASEMGRPIYVDYGYHAWSMGYDDRAKRALLPQLWSSTITTRDWCQLMEQENLRQVIIGPGEDSVEDGRISVKESLVARQLEPSYADDEGWRVWSVEAVCDYL